jgi:hypothetical protein
MKAIPATWANRTDPLYRPTVGIERNRLGKENDAMGVDLGQPIHLLTFAISPLAFFLALRNNHERMNMSLSVTKRCIQKQTEHLCE